MLWFGLIALGLTVGLEVFRWRRTIRLFGAIPRSVPLGMLRFAQASRSAWVVTVAKLTTVVTLVLLPFLMADASTRVLAAAALVNMAGAIAVLSRCAQPPAVLLLTSSSERTPALLERLNLAIFPLRAVALLDTIGLRRWLPLWSLDNLRTSDARMWKGIVNRLIDIAPVVVIDTVGETRAVAQETSLMLAADRVRKAVFLTDGSGVYPALSDNGIDPYQHALRLLDPEDLIDTLRHYALGRKYLPWPVDLTDDHVRAPIAAEEWTTLPSVLMVGVEGFDSEWLLRTAVESDKNLLQICTRWSRLSAAGAEYLVNLTWDFIHDPRLAAISVVTSDVIVVHIAFLRAHGAEIPSNSAVPPHGPLTFEMLNQPDSVQAAVWEWARDVERIAARHGWTTREVTPPVGEELE